MRPTPHADRSRATSPCARLARWLPLALGLPVAAAAARPAPPTPFDLRVEALFRPPLAEQTALSPDGQRVAYTMQAGNDLVIMLMNVEYPGPKLRLVVDEARPVPFSAEKIPAQLRFLAWATADRLVFAPSEFVMLPPSRAITGQASRDDGGPRIYAPIMAVDADGGNPKTLIQAEEFDFLPPDPSAARAVSPEESSALPTQPPPMPRWVSRHLDIVGFAPGDHNHLIIQARGIPRTIATEEFSLDINTGKYTQRPDPPSAAQPGDRGRPAAGVMNNPLRPTGAVAKGGLLEAYAELERKFPRRTVHLLDASDDRRRVLARVTGGGDPGRVYVYQRPENLVVEIFRRAPWLNSANLNDARFFEFDAPDGAHLSGHLTWPNRPRLNPPPVVVEFPTRFPGGAQPEFDPEAQVLADLGFVVVRLNHRSVAGLTAADRAALQAGPDQVAVDDALTALDWVAERNPAHPFDRKRVATLGRGFGGYLALRALQLHPEAFRCAIAIDAPTDLRPWLFPPPAFDGDPPPVRVTDVPAGLLDRDRTDWKKISVIQHADLLTGPVLLLVEPGRNPVIDAAAAELRSKLVALRRAPEYQALDPGFTPGLPRARAAVYRQVEIFFNLRLYDYGVKVGPVKEVK